MCLHTGKLTSSSHYTRSHTTANMLQLTTAVWQPQYAKPQLQLLLLLIMRAQTSMVMPARPEAHGLALACISSW